MDGVPRAQVINGWTDVGVSLAGEGWLWPEPDHTDLAAVSNSVNSAKWWEKGLWANPEPTPPWEWRQHHPKK